MKRKSATKKDLSFPCRLREIRKAQGKSIVHLAHESGITQNKIIYIEMRKGEGLPSTHLKLAKALGVSLDEYFGFPSLEEAPSGQPEIVASDSNVTVEQLAPIPGSEAALRRIQISPRKECVLTRYLNPKRPVFYYLIQGEAKILVQQKEHIMKPGDHIGLSLPGKVRIENLSSLGLILLTFQP